MKTVLITVLLVAVFTMAGAVVGFQVTMADSGTTQMDEPIVYEAPVAPATSATPEGAAPSLPMTPLGNVLTSLDGQLTHVTVSQYRQVMSTRSTAEGWAGAVMLSPVGGLIGLLLALFLSDPIARMLTGRSESASRARLAAAIDKTTWWLR